MDPVFLLTSFVIGLLIGLTSMGGAALMTPFLILIAGVRPTIAIGTDLMYSAITKWFGAGVHWRQGTVDLRMVGRLAAGSVPGGLLGVAAIGRLAAHGLDADRFLRHTTGVLLVIVAAWIMVRCFRERLSGEIRLHPSWLAGWGAVVWGAVVGFCVGFTSVGSGSLIAPFLLLAYPRSPARVVGTDVFHAAILVTVAAAAHSVAGHIDWQLASRLLIGSIPGVLLGSYLAPRLPERKLRMGLAVVLFASGAKLI